MDDLARFNRERWNALVRAGIEYSRPFLELDEDRARQSLDPHGMMGPISGKKVLVLAGGGGQQSAAFAILGADVTVFDLSDAQLEGDRQAASHYGFDLRVEQGDMRDLSRFEDAAFDLVFQPYSINFVPEALAVVNEVSRVLRQGGLYRLDFANPFVIGIDETDWNQGYPMRRAYEDGEVFYSNPDWVFRDGSGKEKRVFGPREFCHTLGFLLNGLLGAGFSLLGLWEELGDANAAPGSLEHFKAVAPSWFKTWWKKLPPPDHS